MRATPDGRLPILRLGALTAGALLIHGYHLGVEDAEIYIPAARKLLDPALYPFATEFFLSHGHLSLFSPILAWTARLTHLSMDWTVLGWYVVSLFAMLASCWMLASACFESARARWCSVLVATAVLTMPATNTALLLIDPYLTARSFSTPLTLFALAAFSRGQVRARQSCHAGDGDDSSADGRLPDLPRRRHVDGRANADPGAERDSRDGLGWTAGDAGWRASDGLSSSPGHGTLSRGALFARLLLPVELGLVSLARDARANGDSCVVLEGQVPQHEAGIYTVEFCDDSVCLISIAAGVVFTSTHEFDMFARLQPLRSFHLITLVFVLLLAGVIGEYAAKGRSWVLGAVSIPLAIGMFFVARDTYASSPQIELPAQTSSNPWVNALLWVRRNTPKDAVFAVDSRYFKDEGTDVHGFRAVSERSALADYFKDGGVVSLFPDLAVEWKQMSNATYGLNHFTADDFKRLQQQYPVVSWTVIHGSAPGGLDCPYNERGYAVCRLGRTSQP